MKKYKQSFLRECQRFAECQSNSSAVPSDVGLHQFFEYESYGKKPEQPDPYFLRLLNGKAWWEWTVNYIADSYLGERWHGWAMLWHDYRDDPAGFNQIRARIGRNYKVDQYCPPMPVE